MSLPHSMAFSTPNGNWLRWRCVRVAWGMFQCFHVFSQHWSFRNLKEPKQRFAKNGYIRSKDLRIHDIETKGFGCLLLFDKFMTCSFESSVVWPYYSFCRFYIYTHLFEYIFIFLEMFKIMLCMYVCLSVCLSVCMSVCMSVCLYVFLCVMWCDVM